MYKRQVYGGMFNGSAITNAIHVVMGLDIGKKDFTRTIGQTIATVSYTHLDVYKRQVYSIPLQLFIIIALL